jgi:signal transduction histidine kinase
VAVGRNEEIRLGVIHATPAQLSQLEKWAADFRKRNARVEAVNEIGLEWYDIYLIGMDTISTEAEKELSSLVIQAPFTPCFVLATRDDEAWVDAALAAGVTHFFSWANINAPQLERAVHFALQRRRVLDALTARESCLAAARERARQQLANILHDGPLQDLIGARFLLGALTPGGSTAEIQSSLQAVIQAVRALCSDLKPPALGPFGLEKAIRAHIQGFQALHPELTITLELDVDQQLLPEWVRLALFRIYQEAILNVAEHAQATHVWVRMLLDDEHLRLTIADDGQGFELPNTWLEFARTERCGLLMMQERVDALKGRMVVQSTPGSGTRVMVQVPLQQPPVPTPAIWAPASQDSAAPDRNG